MHRVACFVGSMCQHSSANANCTVSTRTHRNFPENAISGTIATELSALTSLESMCARMPADLVG
jgi:hypothetical protein